MGDKQPAKSIKKPYLLRSNFVKTIYRDKYRDNNAMKDKHRINDIDKCAIFSLACLVLATAD